MLIKQKLVVSVSFILLSLSLIGFVVIKEQQIKNRHTIYQEHQQTLVKFVESAFHTKELTGLSIAVMLANNKQIQQSLLTNNRALAIDTIHHIEASMRSINYLHDIKFHIHTAKLRSFVRSWDLQSYGDHLGIFRESIVRVKRFKKAFHVAEIGKEGLHFRSLAPVLDENGVYLGSLEVIQPVDTLAQKMTDDEKGFLLLMNKDEINIDFFHSSIPFQQHYMVAQSVFDSTFLRLAKNIDMKVLLAQGYYFGSEYFYTYINRLDDTDHSFGLALVGTKIETVDAAISASEKLMKFLLTNLLVFIVVLLIALALMIGKFVITPLQQLNKSLKSYFEYLLDDKKTIHFIPYSGNDEFSQMGKYLNKSISLSSRLHHDLSNFIQNIDKDVISCELDRNGCLFSKSTAFCKISGFNRGELIGQPYQHIFFCNIQDEDFQFIDQVITAGNIWSGEVQMVSKYGEIYWLSLILTPQHETHDKCSVIAYDITAQKKVEDLTLNLELKVSERTRELSIAKKKLEQSQRHTQESTRYALLIQQDLMAADDELTRQFDQHLLIWQPKDIVGGDTYLFEYYQQTGDFYVMCIDCTGHGIAGAFVTVLVKSIDRQMRELLRQQTSQNISPAWILNYFNGQLKSILHQDDHVGDFNVGFDASVICYTHKKKQILYSGANSPIYYIDDKKVLQTIKGNRYSVGYRSCDIDYQFDEHAIPVTKGMRFYMATDGFIDQKGGSGGFPFGKTRFKKMIEDNQYQNMALQSDQFSNVLEDYQGNNFRIDDITIIGWEM